jgi:hypothetical protein
MEYKASLDTLAKIITVAAIILLMVIGIRSIKFLTISDGDLISIIKHIGILLLCIAVPLFCYYFAPQSYKVDNTDLTIIRPLHNKKIKLTDITEIETIADSVLIPAIRTFGVGGLFGYYGKYYYPKIGRMTYYTTKKTNRILIKTRQGQNIMITPDDLGIIEILKEKIKLNLGID